MKHTAKGSAEGSQGQCYLRLAVLPLKGLYGEAVLAKGRYDEPPLAGEEFS
ncbi:hypothetical protein LR007_04010 [candidate division NPL-UPA2 bacterium]|nr:hypothetical protein [candidate division NPL-UPA2 bacterium]